MIDRISIRDFQAWPRLELPLSPITVIIGETNLGKSSILRALSCVLFNAMEGTAMVRNGAKLSHVELSIDGHTVGWERGVGVNRFSVDGTVFDKPGRAVPSAVQQITQISELEFDGEVVRLQWSPQMDAPFLLADAGAKATRMLGVAGNAAIVAQAARLAQQESRDQVHALNAAQSQVERLREEAKLFDYLDAVAPLADRVTEREWTCADTRARRDALQALVGQRALLTSRQQHLATQWAQGQRVVQVRTRQVQLLAARSVIDAFTERALARAHALRLVRQAQREVALRQHVVALYERQAGLQARADIIRTRQRVAAHGEQVLAQRNAAMRVVVLAQVLERGYQIRDRVQQRVTIEQVRQTAAAAVLDATAAVRAAQEIYDRLLAAFTCPTCGQLRKVA